MASEIPTVPEVFDAVTKFEERVLPIIQRFSQAYAQLYDEVVQKEQQLAQARTLLADYVAECEAGGPYDSYKAARAYLAQYKEQTDE